MITLPCFVVRMTICTTQVAMLYQFAGWLPSVLSWVAMHLSHWEASPKNVISGQWILLNKVHINVFSIPSVCNNRVVDFWYILSLLSLLRGQDSLAHSFHTHLVVVSTDLIFYQLLIISLITANVALSICLTSIFLYSCAVAHCHFHCIGCIMFLWCFLHWRILTKRSSSVHLDMRMNWLYSGVKRSRSKHDHVC